MSQILNPINDSNIPPDVARSFVANSGTAVPAAGVLNVLGTGSFTTLGSGNTLTLELTGLTANNLLYGQGTPTVGLIPPGTAGQILTSNGAAPPSFQNAPAGTSITGTANQVAANGTTGTPQTGSVTLTIAAPLKLASGSAGAPTYSFSADGTTGMYYDGSNRLSLSQGGVQVMFTDGTNFTIVPQNLRISSLIASGAMQLNYTLPGAYPYTATGFDYYISVDTSAAAHTINLPNAPGTGRVFIIKDKTGNAAAHNISITTPGGTVTFDGSTTYTIANNYGSIEVVFDGSNYQVF